MLCFKKKIKEVFVINQFVYFDNNATTKPSKEVIETITPYLNTQFGNPSSIYNFGKKIKLAIEKAREQSASLIGANKNEIIFTSGASESNCTAINCAIKTFKNKKKIITTKVEHVSILEYFKLLENEGIIRVILMLMKTEILTCNNLRMKLMNIQHLFQFNLRTMKQA